MKLRIALATLAAASLAGAPSAFAAPAAPTNLNVADLVGDAIYYDPQLSWNPVSGAAGYQVEINSTNYWAEGSKVCCDPISYSTQRTTFGTLFSPEVVLANNQYYWRVRAIDANEVAGPWAAGPPFNKTFANVVEQSIDNLRLVDENLASIATGSTVATPIVLWDPAPGASSYQVVVAPMASGVCNWSASSSVLWDSKTATPGWTPLGWSKDLNADPLRTNRTPVDDFLTHLSVGVSYCVRVRPVDKASDQTGALIFGEWTHLPANNQPAFTWAGPPTVATCSPCEMTNGDYLRPLTGTTSLQMPVFTWSPIPGAQSYFVVVSRDAAFTTIVDYSYTRVNAYAPRTHTLTKGYADETSDYYWAVLPAQDPGGSGVSAEASSSAPQHFVKQTTPPTLLSPSNGALITTAATTFQYTGVQGARRYRIQVAEDPSFLNIIRETGSYSGIVTDSTAYTSNTAYPTGKTLYWRVQAEAEDGSTVVGLAWSATRTFVKQAGSNASTGLKRLKLATKGYPVRRQYRTVTLTVRNLATNAVVPGATVRLSGAGLTARTKKTGTLGKASFKIRPTRYPAKVTYKVSKIGFTTAYLYQSVRLA
jgi:hypothetical protein